MAAVGTAAGTQDERLERYAELAVRVGANVQPGQPLNVVGLVAQPPSPSIPAAADPCSMRRRSSDMALRCGIAASPAP